MTSYHQHDVRAQLEACFVLFFEYVRGQDFCLLEFALASRNTERVLRYSEAKETLLIINLEHYADETGSFSR